MHICNPSPRKAEKGEGWLGGWQNMNDVFYNLAIVRLKRKKTQRNRQEEFGGKTWKKMDRRKGVPNKTIDDLLGSMFHTYLHVTCLK